MVLFTFRSGPALVHKVSRSLFLDDTLPHTKPLFRCQTTLSLKNRSADLSPLSIALSTFPDIPPLYPPGLPAIYDNYPKAYRLKHKNAHWVDDQPSDGQQRILSRMRREGIVLPEELTKGVVSELTDLYFQGVLTPKPTLAQ